MFLLFGWSSAGEAKEVACSASLVLSAQVLFSGDHLASTVVGEWTAKHEDKGDGFLGISRSFNCEPSCFHP